ncbi:MAG: NAD(P)H-dependent oxidoreductase [Synergistaceae bacterium]|nr:NAD(P)H-dependent oxidoreductase [Synergistaceae bacterium]
MGDKKILTMLLGSPRKGGNSETLADALAAGAAEKGYEVRKVRLAGMTLKGCIDCRRCWSAGTPYIQRDDMDKVYADNQDHRHSRWYVQAL